MTAAQLSNVVGAYDAKTHLPALLERVAVARRSPLPNTARRWPGWFRLEEDDRRAAPRGD